MTEAMLLSRLTTNSRGRHKGRPEQTFQEAGGACRHPRYLTPMGLGVASNVVNRRLRVAVVVEVS